MKQKIIFRFLFVCSALFAACTNDMYEFPELEQRSDSPQTRAARTSISLANDLNGVTLNASNGTATTGGFYWNQTYSNTKYQTTNFTFSHTGGTVSGYNYWDGFTISNVADTNNYGAPGSSDGWIAHQWGCMAVPTGTSNSPNYMVGYWGYYMLDFQNEITTETEFGENKYATWVKLGNNSQTYTVSKVTVAIHPWPYYGNLYGDGFARPFGPGDHFDLIIYGVDGDGAFVRATEETVRKITHAMADYPVGGTLNMPTGWTDITIDFGEPVKYLVFQMYSTDNSGELGPNTAVYFCLRDIVMQ